MLRDRRTGLEVIDRDGCLDLLAGTDIGRVAVLAGREPVIFPVNYALDGDRIVFRTDPGSKFHGVVRNARVSFEIDEFDAAVHEGWSVVAVGRAEEVVDRRERARLEEEVGLQPWAEGPRDHWVVIEPERLSGRRVRRRA
jgi:nitroimidazol reductase NimA-like FMN-containing flavoprotein (pyridoxamine 5'-phosphate oxidase superfamily)